MAELVLKSGYIVKKANRSHKVINPVREENLSIAAVSALVSKQTPLKNSIQSFSSSVLPVLTGLTIGLTSIGLSDVIFKDTFSKNREIEISYNDYVERFRINEAVKVTKKDIQLADLNDVSEESALQKSNQQYVPEVALPVSYNLPSQRVVAEPLFDRPAVSKASAVEKKVYNIIKKFTRNQDAGMKLASRIVAESRRNSYDPLFVAAVIKSESGFNTFATSHVGAKGLMQIMPDTGRFVEKLKDCGPRPAGFLTDPQYNLKLGINYLKHLEEMYDGNKVLTLMAYNWGPGKVNNTVKGKNRGVPKEVMNYALKILHDHNNWRKELFVEG